jgi:hypothetical protein
MVNNLIKKVYIRGSIIYLRDVSKITEKGFYQLDNKLIANGQIIDEWTDWCNLVQQEITARKRNKKINQILNES